MELKKRILHLWSWKFFLPWSKWSIFSCHLKKKWIKDQNHKVPVHNTHFKTHPILIPVFGVSMGWLAAPGPSWPPIWGLGGSPKTSSRTSSRMPSKGLWPHRCPRMLLLGISTLDLGGLLYFYLGGGGERRLLFYDLNTEHIIILCTFATIGA